jgi:hypothetical protein
MASGEWSKKRLDSIGAIFSEASWRYMVGTATVTLSAS